MTDMYVTVSSLTRQSQRTDKPSPSRGGRKVAGITNMYQVNNPTFSVGDEAMQFDIS